MRLSGTKATAIHQYRGLGNQLWDLAGNRPSLDLRFADEKSLVDATTGTNLVDFKRASSGTYVGSDGLIKTATTNLLLRSEEFDNAAWNIKVKLAAFGSGSVANAIAAPDGTITADKIVEDATTGEHYIEQSLSPGAVGVYTYSIFVKSAERFIVNMRPVHVGESVPTSGFTFNAQTGVVSSQSSFVTNVVTQPLQDGWWRISCTLTLAGTNTNRTFRVHLMSPTGTFSYTGDGTSGIYIWGAQLEQSSTVGEYIPTTSTINSAPRFDHDPTTGESLGLLVEESRTNLVLQSQALTTSPWVDSGATTSLASTITDVFGGTSASFKLTEDNSNGSHLVSQGFTLAASTSYSVTAWFKQGSANRDGRILLTNAAAWNGAAAPRARIEFSTGTVQNDLGFTSTSLVRYNNGWYRFTGTALTSASGGNTAFRLLVSDGGEVYQGDGTSYIYVGPCQLEVGSFPTSYIPTVGAGVITPGYTTPAVTRAADVASISGNNFGTTNLLRYSEEFDTAGTWLYASSTITPNEITAPNGTLTADRLENNASASNSVYFVGQTFAFAAGVTYTTSVYVKAGTSAYFQILVPINATADSNSSLNFNLLTGAVSSVTAGATAQATDFGNGWYRVSISVTAYAAKSAAIQFRVGDKDSGSFFFASSGGSSIYIWGAQLEQSDVATPYVKSNVTWNSRASNATYYDSTGTIRKSSYNELLRSEEFDQSPWIPTGMLAFGSGSSVNAITAPDGTMTADLLTENISTGVHEIRQNYSYQSGVTYTWSVFFKAASGTRNLQIILSTGAFPGNPFVHINPTTGAVIASSDINASAQPYPNGWYRASFSATADANSADQFYLRLMDGTSFAYTGDGTSGIYVWGAQLEKGTYAGDYAKTEATAASTARNAAYLPDDNGNFVSAGPLLLEEQRTNLITNSSLTTGGTTAGATISSTTETNPEGIDSCQRLLSGGATSEHRVYVTASSLNNITVSAFVKKDTHRYVYIGFGGAANSFTALFDIDPTVTGDRLLGEGGSGTYTNIDAGYQNFPNGWVRIWAVGTTSGTNGTTIGFSPDDSTYNITNWDAAGTEAIFIHGVQYEDNVTYPSSYIPTYGIAAARSADVSTSTSGFGNSWYRQDEGTVFTRFNSYPQEGSTLFCWSLYEDTPNYLGLRSATGYTPDRITNLSRVSNSNEFSGEGDANGYITAPANDARNAFAYMTDDFGVSWNGGTSFSSSSGAIPAAPSKFTIGTNNGVNHLNGTIRRLCYWNQRLPNSTLSTITQ